MRPPKGRRPGGKQLYSDLAIVTSLTLRTVFRLALRQTEGFVASLIGFMELDIEAPDHTTLSRRSATVGVPSLGRMPPGPVHLVIDSTALKMLGDGEWHVHKHRTSNKRRRWRRLHLGVDAHGFIIASKLTGSGADDGCIGTAVIKEIGEVEVAIERFTADGAYDSKEIYAAVTAADKPGVTIVIPSSRIASRSKPVNPLLAQRDAAIGRVAEVGRR